MFRLFHTTRYYLKTGTVGRDYTKPIIRKMKKLNVSLLNTICRICGQEAKNCTPVFSENGKKQAIQKKIRTCLNLTVEETDLFPKQLCIACLNKLETSWDLYQLSKEGQIIITMKLQATDPSTKNNQDLNSANNNEVLTLCGVCNLEVHDNHLGVGCEGKCEKWFHCQCINMSELEYNKMANDSSRIWICDSCKTPSQAVEQNLFVSSIEQKLNTLKENEKMLLSGTSFIYLVPVTAPASEDTAPSVAPMVASSLEMLGAQPGPSLVNSDPVSFMQSPAVPVEQAPIDDGVFPERLIKVNPTGKPVVYQHSQQRQQTKPPVPAPRRSVPAPKLLPSPRRNVASLVKRRALKEGSSIHTQPSKRSNQMCRYCNKSFPDNIIDHHVNLHLRQSFITCIDCNKNFRSEEAMTRHRCGASDSINLDSDEDEPICL